MGSLQSDTTERLSCIGEGNGNPLQCSCLENPRDGKSGGLPSMGSHRVEHDWSNTAAARWSTPWLPCGGRESLRVLRMCLSPCSQGAKTTAAGPWPCHIPTTHSVPVREVAQGATCRERRPHPYSCICSTAPQKKSLKSTERLKTWS